MDLYLVESCDYVFGIYSDLDLAVRKIKEKYNNPFIVEWDDLTQEGDFIILRGHFKSVDHYSVKCDEDFLITKRTLND